MFTLDQGCVVSSATVDAEAAHDGQRLTVLPHRETEMGVMVRTGTAS